MPPLSSSGSRGSRHTERCQECGVSLPPGRPLCGACFHRLSTSASATVEPSAPAAGRCRVCDEPLAHGDICPRCRRALSDIGQVQKQSNSVPKPLANAIFSMADWVLVLFCGVIGIILAIVGVAILDVLGNKGPSFKMGAALGIFFGAMIYGALRRWLRRKLGLEEDDSLW